MAFLSVEQLEGQASSTSGIAVDFVRDWRQAALRVGTGGHRTPFQHGYWLDAWYEAFSDVSPLVAVISHAATATDIALLPMISRASGGLRVVEFADGDLSDNNGPILLQDWACDAASAPAIGRALVSALRAQPEGFDLLRLKKMPAQVGGKPNPLVRLGRIGSCSLNGNLLLLDDDYASYQARIKRLQMGRCWRVFSRHPGARFEIAGDIDQAFRILDVMDVQQRDRMKQLGLRFVLGDEKQAKFYRDVVRRGIADGYAIVSALVCEEGIVATTLGVRCGANYVLLRTSNAGKPWSNCSPGLLAIERTMAALHATGIRRFDLSVGNYEYKRRFGAVRQPLTDVSIALSWRGLPHLLRDSTAQYVHRHPKLAAFAARALGKASG